MKTPDVGAIVEYGSNGFGCPLKWKVTGWLRSIGGQELQFCHPREATHLSLSGECMTFASVAEVKIVGRVEWDKRLYRAEVGHANYLAAVHAVIPCH